MNLFKKLINALTPKPVEHPYHPAEVEAIGFNAVAEALNVSPTLEGGWPGPGEHVVIDRSVSDGVRSAGIRLAVAVDDEPAKRIFGNGLSETIEINNGAARMVEPAPGLLERHTELAAQAIDKFSADEARLINAIKAAEADHAEHIAGLRAELADTRTALRFYRTGPDMLKRRAERTTAPAKPKSKPRRPKITRLVKTPAPAKPKSKPRRPVKTVPAAPIIDPDLVPEKARGITNDPNPVFGTE